MAPPGDLREWIARLEREGELVRVAAEVDADLEITEIVDRVVKSGGPALLFENVKGAQHPLLINQFGTEKRMCMAFDAPSLDAVAARVAGVLEMQPPEGLREKIRGLRELKSIADSRPKTVKRGASQEVVLTGDDVDLDLLPIQRCWPGDPAPFITLPAVITHDPRTGTRNVGMYRLQKVDRRTTYMHWQIHKDGRADYLLADAWLGKATERIFLPAVKMTVPEIVDYDLPVAGAFHNICIVSIRKAFPGHARKVMHAIWGLGMLSLTKGVIVVDAHVDVHDYGKVAFYVGANVDPQRDVVISEGPLDHLDHAPTRQFVGGKIGIDATAKGPLEGAREWPPEIDMTPEVRDLVDRRWSEYGIETDPSAGNGGIRQSSRRLLRR